MQKFRRKPVVMEAEQYFDGKKNMRGVCEKVVAGCVLGPHIHTLEGPLHVSSGDWIVTGLQGEQWPVKPDIFALTYEPADTPPEDNSDLCEECGSATGWICVCNF